MELGQSPYAPLRSSLRGVLAFLCLAICLPRPASGSPEDVRAQVRIFARNQYVHGVPYLEARALGAGGIAPLHAILKDEREKRYWTTAIEAIAFIDADESYPIIRHFIWNRFTGSIDDTTLHAVISAVSVLGTISETSAPTIIDDLIAATRPQYWQSLPWSCSVRDVARNRWFAQVATTSLQWTGSSRADSLFDALLESPDRVVTIGTLPELKERCARVRTLGLEGYERAQREQRRREGGR